MSTQFSSMVLPSRTFAGAPALDDRKRGVAEDVLQRLKYSFLVAAADPDAAVSPGGVEDAFLRALRGLKADQQPRARERANAFLSQPVEARRAELGRYASIEPSNYRQLGFERARGPTNVVIDADVLAQKLLKIHSPEAVKQNGKPPAIDLDLPVLERARFMITEVRCVDETNPEPFGNDEILMGGFAIGWKGDVRKVSPFLVDDDFEDGKVVKYGNPGREFASFDLRAKGDWPRTFAAVVYLAEEDWGGFMSTLNASLELLSKKIHDEIVKIGVSVLAEYFGEEFAKIIGEIVTWIYNSILSWILSIILDDIFLPGCAVGGVHTPLALIYKDSGGWKDYRSPVGTFKFVGHGGEYRVKGYWKLEVVIV